MPDPNNKKATKEIDISEDAPSNEQADRGPPGFPYVIEIHMTDRIFTLFTDSQDQAKQWFNFID